MLKRLLSSLVALLLLLCVCATAECDDNAALKASLEVTNAMCANVSDVKADGMYGFFVDGINKLPGSQPEKAAVITVAQPYVEGLCAALRCEKSGLASALNIAVNSQFSAEYVQIADRCLYSGSVASAPDSANATLVMLVYTHHISLSIFLPDGSAQGVFLESERAVAERFGEAYVTATLAQYGITASAITIYDGGYVASLTRLPEIAEKMKLDDVLCLIDAGVELPDRIELTDDFSALVPLGGNDCVPSNDGIAVLCRVAPLKDYVAQDTPFDDDYTGYDIGLPTVYIDVKTMLGMPAESRARSAAEIKTIVMAESLYLPTASISSSGYRDDSLPDMAALEAAMNGETTESETTETRTNYRPVFTGYAMVNIYNPDGASKIAAYNEVPYAELRDNPAADDIWDKADEMLSLCQIALQYTDAEILEGILDYAEYIDPEDIENLRGLASDSETYALYCYYSVWALAEQLKEADPEAAEYYDKVIAEESLNGLVYLANARQYSAVTADDSIIKGQKKYIGVVSQQDIDKILSESVEIFDVFSWNMELLFSLI